MHLGKLKEVCDNRGIMPTRIKFLPCHEHKVLIITVENQTGLAQRVTAGDYRPFLSQHPIISTYAPVTDLRGFAGYIGIADLADITADFRAARLALGHEPFLTVPQVMIFDPNSYAYSRFQQPYTRNLWHLRR